MKKLLQKQVFLFPLKRGQNLMKMGLRPYMKKSHVKALNGGTEILCSIA